MESTFKTRISRMFPFRSSFGSCRSKNVSDVIQNPVFVPHQNRRECHSDDDDDDDDDALILPRKFRAFQSRKNEDFHQRKKVSDRGVFYFVTGDTDGRMCPPASPISPLINSKPERVEKGTEKIMIKKKKKKKKKENVKKLERYHLISSSGDSTVTGWFSSEEEEEEEREEHETEKFFSSKSFSSDSSSESDLRKQNKNKTKKKKKKKKKKKSSSRRRRADTNRDFEMCIGPVGQQVTTKGNKVEESFAIVKRSSDPYSDFRKSMVEMIVEKQLFAVKDLEQLLQCFLYLNPSYHHRVIVEVFSEIWDVLFSNWY